MQDDLAAEDDKWASVKHENIQNKLDDVHPEISSLDNVQSGVERMVDIPADCKRDDPQYQWGRRKLVRNLSERLAREGKRLVERVRFLDDGIVYEWVRSQVPTAQNTRYSSSLDHHDDDNFHSDMDKSIHEMELLDMSLDTEEKDEVRHSLRDARSKHCDGGTVENPIAIDDEDETLSMSMSMSSSSDSSHERGCARLKHLIAGLHAEERPGASDDAPKRTVTRAPLSLQPEGITPPKATRRTNAATCPLSSIDWSNYRKIIILKNVPLDVTEEQIYGLLLAAGFPFARVLRLMLHDTRGEKIRLASVQFYTDNDATIAMSELRDVGPSRTWWRKIVIQPCDVPKRFAADTDTSSSKGKSASTEMSQLRRASNEKPSSLIGKRRYRDGDDNDVAAPAKGFRALSRSSGQLYTTQRSSSAEFDRTRNNSKGTEKAILLHAPSHVSDADTNDKSDKSYDDSSESPTSDVEETPYSRHIGTVPHSVPIGERTLNETACCPLPRVQHGRPRRLLVPPTTEIPMIAVTIRGDLQFVDLDKRCRISRMSMPAEQLSLLRVSDACFVGDTAFIAYHQATPQVSMVMYHEAEGRAHKLELKKTPHSSAGISCITPMQSDSKSMVFLTGGYDKRIFLWSHDPMTHQYPATLENLPFDHNTTVSAMAWRSSDETLVSSSGNKVWTYSMKKGLLGKPAEISNKVYQVHLHPQSPHIAILEVDHLDRQILVYDIRRSGFDRKPSFELGLREHDRGGLTKSKHRKGDTHLSYFARGYQDGTVAIWDYRNPKAPVLAANKCRSPVWHTVFSRSATPSVWAYAAGACINLTT